MNLTIKLLPFLIFVLLFTGCDDDDNGSQPDLQVPTSYNDFENVSYDGQTQRLAQMTEITAYMKSANTSGVELDAARLQAMYANAEGAMFAGTYDDSKQLRSKTLSSVQADFESYFDNIALASTSDVAAADGVAGVSVSQDGTKQYLLNENGVEYTQVIEKGLMGACFYYQATAVYMGDERMNVDNEVIEPGEGTEMEHHWDEAFGYFGVPEAFPVDTDGAVFWGKYCNDRDALLGTNAELMNALLKGRAAITADRLDLRDEAIDEARNAWERVVAGTAVHYLNSTMSNWDDFALRAHAQSEAVAFIYSLKFNEDKTLTNAQVDDYLERVGGSTDFNEMDFYEIDREVIEAVRDEMGAAFNFGSATTEL
ncbi:DUF4856 domain-containing protein [Lewinellaceae bacterium SD302]|nr:DUF4856 domain-containing protein [Lewinellaceae bacterium SD302]